MDADARAAKGEDMTDLAARLKNWRSVHLARLHLLMEEAADEMAVLRADNSRRANLEQGLRDAIVRLSANGDFPGRDNVANEDNTPAAHATQCEGSEQNGCTLAAEVRRLRAAITALAAEDATLSICNGNVTVDMDASLTDKEKDAVMLAYHQMRIIRADSAAATLRALLERTK